MEDVVSVLLIVVGVFAVGSAFGWFMREQMAMRKVHKMFAAAEIEQKKMVEDNTIRAKLEIHDGHYYMFDQDTDAFLAQGSDQKELSEMLRKKFPKAIFILSKDSYAELGVNNESI